MRSPVLTIVALSMALGACAGSQSEMRLLESDGTIRIEPSRTAGASYDVTMRNTTDLVGYHAEEKANRDEYALRLARPQCAGATVIGEDKIETGSFLLGNPSRTYVVHVRCG